MKRLLTIFLSLTLVFGALALTGCTKEIEDLINSITDGLNGNNDSTGEDENADSIVGKYVFYEFYSKYDGTVARARYSDLGAPYIKTDGSAEFKDDNTFTINLLEMTITGTWKKENGKYYGTPEAENGEPVELEIVMEDDDHLFFPPNDDPGAMQIGFIFERENAAATPSDPEGTYKLYESKKLDNDKEVRVRVTDPNSLDSAEDLVATFNSDGTVSVSGLGMSASGTWERNGYTLTVTVIADDAAGVPGNAPSVSTLTFEDGEWAYKITDVSTWYIKKVA
ncbi:MAG: hypothetical protein J6126_02040 [Clostridia bacterium]|nr:hypothetical protein [Clostridia bacterium]